MRKFLGQTCASQKTVLFTTKPKNVLSACDCSTLTNVCAYAVGGGAAYPQLRSKLGFTLAEVLITLGIIGVVAALTIPSLIADYQKKVVVSKLQSAIAVINEAYKRSLNEVGSPTEAIPYDEYFVRYWKPFINATYCKTYKTCKYDSYTPFLYTNGNQSYAAIVNGAALTFYTPQGVVYRINNKFDNSDEIVVLIDINGAEKPNKNCRDVFNLTMTDKGIFPACYNKSDSYIDSYIEGCCTEKMRRAGWKIKDDYPW